METLNQQSAQPPSSPPKPLSGWLCASDVDGTLVTAVGAVLPPANKRAIARFQRLGGRFTIASGRSVPSARLVIKRLGLWETPAVILNGGGVYDFAENKMLRYHPIPKEGAALAFELCRQFPCLQFQALRRDSSHILNVGTASFFASGANRLPRKFHRTLTGFPRDDWGKAIFYGRRDDIAELAGYCRSLRDAPLLFMESSGVSFEILAPGVHKGSALLELADILGVDRERLAGIGNYDNDAGLLECSAVTAAPANSPESFKARAQYIVCPDRKGAVAEFLGILERMETSGR